MALASLLYPIDHERVSPQHDGDGGFTEAWTSLGTVSGRITKPTGKPLEAPGPAQTDSTATVRVFLAGSADVRDGDRLDGRLYVVGDPQPIPGRDGTTHHQIAYATVRNPDR